MSSTLRGYLRIWPWTLIFIGICIIGALAQSPPSSEVLDPLVADPHHYHLEFQNSWVRVIRERMGPRENAAWHRHPQPGAVIVLLTDQHLRQTLQDGTTRVIQRNAGTTIWSPASTHKGENLNDATFEYVAVEPKIFGNGVLGRVSDKVTFESDQPENYQVEVENDLVRVVRAILAPQQKLASQKYWAAVIVYLTDHHVKEQSPTNGATDRLYKAGQVRWVTNNQMQTIENLSTARVELIRIELKQAHDQ